MKRSTSSKSLPPPFRVPGLIDHQEAQTGDTRDESDGDSKPRDSLHSQLVASHHNPSFSAPGWFARIRPDDSSTTVQGMYEEVSQVANDDVSSIRTFASFSAEENLIKM
ncbi:Hypothetical predicted protein [Olea europaea subsp. europaea]|uniref:Uncharacterized protein n=1 Tax=Olea europaea subsp. europaea TaxID=158383 RepID=A0A8S0VIJ5_OLEEU|nr:Hypothetical predicted protein [Olea europaea subsp. europaea]